jgi:DNA-binding MarR family transcriptional regulator
VPVKAPNCTESAAAEAWRLLAGLVYPPPFLAIAREHDLRPASFGVLKALDRPRTMSELASELNCDNSNVTGLVDGLEARVLVSREPSERDRRVRLIALTAEGKRFRTRLMRAVATPPEWLERLSETDQRALADLLGRASQPPG